jgi:DNA-binding transcriptional regulator YdaS (Cro superfamily)
MGPRVTTVVASVKQQKLLGVKQLLYDLSMSALLRAVTLLNGQAALATAIGVKQQHIWNWLNRPGGVPAEHCPAIERATKGEVRCEQLRPDVPWDVLREQAPVQAIPVIEAAPAQEEARHAS